MPTTITISVGIERLFTLVNQRTLYIADQVDPELNMLMVDKIPITRDEYDAFYVLMKRAATEVFKRISRLAFDLEDPFVYETTVDDPDTEINIVYKVVIPDGRQPAVIEPILKDHIERAIIAFIIMEWLRIKNIPNSSYYQLDIDELKYALDELSKLVNFGAKARLNYHYN